MNATFARRSAAIASLDKIRRILGLSETQLGDLFSVTRRTIDRWRKHGVPVGRSADVDRVAELARFLEREATSSRVPQIVRTRGRDKNDSLRGRSILSVIRDEGVIPVNCHLERLFSYKGA